MRISSSKSLETPLVEDLPHMAGCVYGYANSAEGDIKASLFRLSLLSQTLRVVERWLAVASRRRDGTRYGASSLRYYNAQYN